MPNDAFPTTSIPNPGVKHPGVGVEVGGVSEEERGYWVGVMETEGLGPVAFSKLFTAFGSAGAIWRASLSDLCEAGCSQKVAERLVARRKKVDPQRHLKELAKKGVRAVCVVEEEYPSLLRSIQRPPPLLFLRGTFTPADRRAVAVVGTRKPSAYGREVAERLVTELVVAGCTIVSGLARGIDAIAHRTALEHGGRTIGFLGGGPDRVYPSEHVQLAERMAQSGAVVSEFPPGLEPLRGNFPARNRLISGMSLGVLVVEGMSRSGTKHTADHAKTQQRPVLAVPGPITSQLSDAPNDLLGMGAVPVRSGADIVKALGLDVDNTVDNGGVTNPNKRVISFETDEEKLIYDALQNGSMSADEIVRTINLSTHTISATLTMMEMKGLVKHFGGGMYGRL